MCGEGVLCVVRVCDQGTCDMQEVYTCGECSVRCPGGTVCLQVCCRCGKSTVRAPPIMTQFQAGYNSRY